jgi:hypothetical protein
MSKAVKHSAMAIEIKKEYLMQHLEDVKSLIRRWTSECHARPPFERQEPYWGWQAVYQSSVMQIDSNSHMLRRHLRSRALWSHHADWQFKLQDVWNLINQVRSKADIRYRQLTENNQRQYTQDFLDTALWQGFKMACGEKLENMYRIPDNQKGFAIGAYNIEISVTSPDDRSSVEMEHQNFIHYVVKLKEMKDLTILWSEVRRVQEYMSSISIKALKSNDILYACTFCKHLWK